VQKYKIVYLLGFLFTILVTPVKIMTYVAGIELAIDYKWVFFGIFNPLFYQYTFGGINLFLLLVLPFLVSRILTLLYIKVFKQECSSVFWTTAYFKQLAKNSIFSTILILLFTYIVAVVIGFTGIFSSNIDLLSILYTVSFVLLVIFAYKAKLLTTNFQKVIYFVELLILNVITQFAISQVLTSLTH
jgi:hypothetical protein